MATKKWAITTAGTAPSGYESTTYTSYQTWSVAEAYDIATANDSIFIEAFDDWASGHTVPGQQIRDSHGWATDSTYYITAQAADGEGHGGVIGGGYYIITSSNEGSILPYNVDCLIQDIEVTQTGSSYAITMYFANAGVNKINRCIVDAGSASNGITTRDNATVILNTLLYDGGDRGPDGAAAVVNCTIDDFPNDYALLVRGNVCKNVVVTNSRGTSDPFYQDSTPNTDYCATDYSGGVSGTNSFVLTGDPYNDSANNDYSIDNTSELYDAGVDLSSTYPELAYDIAGNPRSSTYSIGAYEYVGGGGTTVTVGTGSFTLTGNAATLTVGRKLAADAQSYTLTGQDAALKRGFVALAEAGTITLTGQAAALIAARKIAAAQATYTYTGNDAGLTYTPAGSYDLVADAASYTLTGIAATLAVDRLIGAQTAAYTLTGVDAGLTYTPAGATTMTAEAAAFTLTGQASALLYARILPATVQTYAVTGQNVALRRGYSLALDAGAYSLSGLDVDWARTYQVAAGVGAYALTGRNVTLTYSEAELIRLGTIAHLVQAERGAVLVWYDRCARLIN